LCINLITIYQRMHIRWNPA